MENYVVSQSVLFFQRDIKIMWVWWERVDNFLSNLTWRKSRKHSFNTEVIMDSSISRLWMLHAIFLSDGNDLLWECWYNLSFIWPISGYTKSWYTRMGCVKKWLQASPPLLSPVSSCYFLVFALSQFSGPDYLEAWNRLAIRAIS